MNDAPKTSRRRLIVGALSLAAVGIGWQAWVRRPRPMIFEPIATLPGWRQTIFEGVSAPPGGLSRSAAFAGIGAGAVPIEVLEPSDLCRTLFPRARSGKVPVAVFSDFFCPYCRTLTERLASRATDPSWDALINWHELPLLGPSSVIAARAAVAADLQRAYPEFQARMSGSTFRPTPQFLIETATAIGLDPAKFVADMESQVVDSRLSRARNAAQTLGIYGTPAMVVGRTLVIGEISDRHLDELIELEGDTPASC